MINSFNVGLKMGGDNRPLIIQPIGESMKEKQDFLKFLNSQIDLAIEKESKDIKPDEKIKVSIDYDYPAGIIIHAKKIKK